MIEPMETPTFVVEDYYDAKGIKLFKYLDVERIPFEILELRSPEIEKRESPYFLVILDDLQPELDLFEAIPEQALALAQSEKLILVFIYEGYKNMSEHLKGSLLTQMLQKNVSFNNIRVVTSVKALTMLAPYIYFSFTEMDTYIGAIEGDLFVEGFCETKRDNIFTCNVTKDTPHARLFAASIWYHNLAEYSYFNYPGQVTTDEILKSEVYHWNEHWNSTSTLMDMFGQQLPVVKEPGSELDYYNNAYWNFAVMPSFRSKELSISKEVFKPMLNLQPFVIVGPPHTLTVLKSMGYKTFSDLVNEFYDKIAGNESRMQDLFRLIYEMVHYTGSELDDLNSRLRKILIHNQQHLLSSKRHKLISLLNTLKTRI